MKIVIAGGTGFVGKALIKELSKSEHEIIILTRKVENHHQNERIRFVQWLTPNSPSAEFLQNTEVFINLAGESLNSGRWTSERKKTILNSRIQSVDALITIMKNLDKKPSVFINASAIGIYGTSEEKVFSEDDKGSGNDFLAKTVMRWENEASRATQLGIRTVLCRFGIILDKNEGALPKIALPYKSFIGGNIGTGRQWMSWIHIKDVVKGILFAIDNQEIEGPVNFTAPRPVTMSDLGKTLASIINRPHWLPVPSFALQLLLGEMSTLVVEGQKVLPKKLIDNGYQFNYPELPAALKNIFY